MKINSQIIIFSFSALLMLSLLACAGNTGDATTSGEVASSEKSTAETPAPPQPPAQNATPFGNAQPGANIQADVKVGDLNYSLRVTNSMQSIIGLKVDGLGTPFNYSAQIKALVLDHAVLDLDQDGFTEIYLKLSPVDPERKLDIMGFASMKNAAMTAINIQNLPEPASAKQDEFLIEDDRLFRETLDADGNSVRYEYKLEQGEAAYQLVPVKV